MRVVVPSTTVGYPSVGRVGRHTLVSWKEDGPPDSSGVPSYYDLKARWLDDALQRVGQDVDLGFMAEGFRAHWVSDGAAVSAQIWADPTKASAAPVEKDVVYVWRLTPPPSQQSDYLHVPVDSGADSLFIGVSGASAIATPPTALAYGSVFSAFAATPPGTWPCTGDSSFLRLFAARDGGGATMILWGDNLCPSGPSGPWNALLEVDNPWLVSLGDGGLGALIRFGGAGGPYPLGAVHYLRLGPDLAPDGPPRAVGDSRVESYFIGAQPRGAASGGRVTFGEFRTVSYDAPVQGGSDCYLLRVMAEDGSDARAAPWQLPCLREAAPNPVTTSIEIVSVPGANVLVWSERRPGPDPLVVDAGTPFSEAVDVVLLTSDGRRGSEIVAATDPDASTAVQLFAGSSRFIPQLFLPDAAADGVDLSVVWLDRRPSAPGIYARSLRCVVGP